MGRKRWNAILDRLPEGQRIVGVEVGVWMGKNANHLLMARPELTLYLVDQWKAAEPGTSFADSGAEMASYPQADFDAARANVMVMAERYGRRAKVIELESAAGASEIARRRVKIDFIFIDGDHSYEGVKADLEAWAPFIERGITFIAGHDYANKRGEVKRAVDEFFGEDVVQVDEDHTWFVMAADVDRSIGHVSETENDEPDESEDSEGSSPQ